MTVKVEDHSLGGVKYSHPSYGMINISKVSGSSQFFGSDLKHDTFFEIEVTGASQINDLGRCWYLPDDTKIKVRMSNAQFVEMIGSMNTSGVPCTLNWEKNTGGLTYEAPPTPLEYSEDYIDETVENAKVIDQKLVTRAKDILTSKRGIRKAEKEELLSLINSLSTQVSSNLEFAAEQGKRAVNKMKSSALVEVDARLQHLVVETGIEVLKDKELTQKLLDKKLED